MVGKWLDRKSLGFGAYSAYFTTKKSSDGFVVKSKNNHLRRERKIEARMEFKNDWLTKLALI